MKLLLGLFSYKFNSLKMWGSLMLRRGTWGKYWHLIMQFETGSSLSSFWLFHHCDHQSGKGSMYQCLCEGAFSGDMAPTSRTSQVYPRQVPQLKCTCLVQSVQQYNLQSQQLKKNSSGRSAINVMCLIAMSNAAREPAEDFLTAEYS